MNKSDVLILVISKPNVYCIENRFKQYFPEFYNEILSWNFPPNFKFSQKMYHYFYNDIDLKLGKCPICCNPCRFRNFIYGYSKYCSNICSNNSKDWKEKVNNIHIKNNHQLKMSDAHIKNVNQHMIENTHILFLFHQIEYIIVNVLIKIVHYVMKSILI